MGSGNIKKFSPTGTCEGVEYVRLHNGKRSDARGPNLVREPDRRSVFLVSGRCQGLKLRLQMHLPR